MPNTEYFPKPLRDEYVRLRGALMVENAIASGDNPLMVLPYYEMNFDAFVPPTLETARTVFQADVIRAGRADRRKRLRTRFDVVCNKLGY